VPYTQDKHIASSSYNLQSVQAAMTDMFTRGTMTVAVRPLPLELPQAGLLVCSCSRFHSPGAFSPPLPFPLCSSMSTRTS